MFVSFGEKVPLFAKDRDGPSADHIASMSAFVASLEQGARATPRLAVCALTKTLP
jgi:hypothetical protein